MESSKMKQPLSMRLFALALLKHLPPSASALRLLDWSDGVLEAEFSLLRADLQIMRRRPDAAIPPDSVDAIIAFDQALNADALAQGLRLLRPGGRLIAVDPAGTLDKRYLERLESAGYTRILVEAAIDDPNVAEAPVGVLLRGEKQHTTADTLARVQVAAARDLPSGAGVDLSAYTGHYVHVLVRQTPNTPIWMRADDEPLRWDAVSVDGAVLVFSSLPKAVAFMQQAVLRGQIVGVNKIAKFRAEVVRLTWTHPTRVNPDSEALDGRAVDFLPLDPTTAEQPDE
jgi:SAM-dependent methyltransferase